MRIQVNVSSDVASLLDILSKNSGISRSSLCSYYIYRSLISDCPEYFSSSEVGVSITPDFVTRYKSESND